MTSTISDVIEKLPDWIESIAMKTHNELRALIAERFGELIGQLNSISPEMRARAVRSEPFRFANEKTENHDESAMELPNWRRGNGTVIN